LKTGQFYVERDDILLKRIFKIFILLIIPILLLPAPFSLHLEAESATVYIIPVKGQIEPGWLLFLKRSLKEARESGAQAVILEVDTPGGFIDTAQEAKKLLDELTIPVYGLVNNDALSAGAYLTLATDGFYMTPGSTIGAAEPVLLTGKEVDEKILSFWEAEMRSTAEKQGKDPLIAAAMVRRPLAIEGLVREGELLTLTTVQAEKISFSDGTVNSVEELLDKVNLSGSNIIYSSATFWERLSGWLINPIIATILLMMGFFFMVVEIMTPGFGVGGLLSLIAFGLYFGGHFLTGVSGWPAIFLFGLGIILLLIEAFIPGFGIFGISGLIAVIIAIVLAAASTASGIYTLLVSLFVAAIASFIAFKYLQRKGALKRIVLLESATREAGFSSSADYTYLLGKEGKTVTPLRPSGMVEIEGKRYDTISESGYIDSGEMVEVGKVEGYRIVVRKKDIINYK